MRVLEAYALLDDAVNEFYTKRIDRPEVHEALTVLERYCVTKYEIEALKEHLRRQPGPPGWTVNKQADGLGAAFAAIHRSVRFSLEEHTYQLNLKSCKNKALLPEYTRLITALGKMPMRWRYRAGSVPDIPPPTEHLDELKRLFARTWGSHIQT